MCLYWKKLHTCGDISDRPYIEMCHAGVLSNAVCPDISNDPKPRKSHFPCYTCIKNEARAELENKVKAMEDAEAKEKAFEAQQRAVKEKHIYEQRLKEERVRREARDKAARERDEEMRIKRMKEEEERKAKKEGGMWIESGSGKKGKARKSGGATLGNPLSPISKTPGGGLHENRVLGGGGADKSPKKGSVDPGGRAGVWGPKKILSRKENGNGAHGLSGGVNGTFNGNGGPKK